jgi:hypothetical protein
MSGALQSVFQNQRSFKPPIPAAIGAAYGGGYFAGQINVSGVVYNLVVCDKTVGETHGLLWGPTATTTGITSVIAGPTNSASLAALGASYAAATFCEGINTGGFTDWYMPAKNELEVLYYFLKPETTSNSTSDGSNANAVSPEPISTNYSAGSPAQTSATSFRTGASSQEFIANNTYWSSSENTANAAWGQYFTTGLQYTTSKDSDNRTTRAVRRITA